MTVGLPSALARPAVAPDATAEERHRAEIRDAATQFESLLLQQIVQVMRSTVGESGIFGGGAGSDMYAHLFDQSFADSMAAAGGIGMREVIERSMLGPAAYGAQTMDPVSASPFVPRSVGPVLEARPPSGMPLSGAVGRLQSVARGMLGPSGVAPQWGRHGRLSEIDLASDFRTDGPEGVAVFNVQDAAGFEDRYKCNLFAFELARRAGFRVPLIGRTRGWGYMGPDGVTADAGRGRLRADWGRVVTGESAESLDSSVVRGERAFLLTGSGGGDRAGHMGVVERVHEIHYDREGGIDRVVFDGWEGRASGAMHLERRTWVRSGTRGGPGARGGFERIEVIELTEPSEGGRPETPTHRSARPSVRDASRVFSSSSTRGRPMTGS